MPDFASGSSTLGQDTPPSRADQDWTSQLNIPLSTYVAGTPEVGVTFTAPTSGRVLVCTGGGTRNNAATNEQAVISYIIYEDNSAGATVVSASIYNGIQSSGVAASQEYRYVCGYNMEQGLEPGRQYYAQVVHRSQNAAGTADISSRTITVIPLS